MRVISGKYRGLKLTPFDGEEIRPTADRVKESVFNILYGEIAGATVLDLFCGSGSLGIECLSRGAQRVDFNDISPRSAQIARGNIAKLKGAEGYSVTVGDYSSFLKKNKIAYDIIFIDPPYASESGRGALELIASCGALSKGGVAVYERDRAFEGEIKGLKKIDERKYGKTFVTFFAPDEETV